MPHLITCAHCHQPAELGKPGRFCSRLCRVRASRERQSALTAAAASHAEMALAVGNVAALEAAARRTMALLARD